ncbi:MAG: hypothetical protein AVO35_03815 [Candidatus Aegiribacteria sp. MLS_C]|nr:MAG: hypothetical protein AVO35_03815 [Candidatus Aegiribacteria sp. MLS_C]
MRMIDGLPDIRRGKVFHLLGAATVFAAWRLTGMPAPGTLGRLLPLAWAVTAVVHDGSRESAASRYLLGLFLLLSFVWTVSPVIPMLAAAIALTALVPSLLSVSGRRYGIIMAVLPLLPLVLVLVPFTGDEPHYARITESLFPGSGGEFAAFAAQSGDPVEGISHHQMLYPVLLLPGYPLGIQGLRVVNLAFAVAAAWILSLLLRDSGCVRWERLAVLGLFLMPGGGVLGLVYPGWLALLLLLLGVLLHRRHGGWLAVSVAALLLVLLKIRFIGISAGLFLALTLEYRGRRRWLMPLALSAAVAAGLLFDLIILGGRVFWVRYGNPAFLMTLLVQPLYRMPELLLSLIGTLVDIESGLLWRAPWVLAAMAGIPVLRREDRSLFRWLGLPAICYLLFLVYWAGYNWSGSPTPSGRMLLPVLPLLIASLGRVWSNRGTRLLVWISAGIAAAHFCSPELRFNHADGMDAMVSLLAGPSSGIHPWLPATVRASVPVFSLWTAVAVSMSLLIYRNSRYSETFAAIVLALLCFLGSTTRRVWQAEDLPPSMVHGCRPYPGEDDPESRKYWMFSRQRMLEMDEEGDLVSLPLPSGADTVSVRIGCRIPPGAHPGGIRAACGPWSDTLYGSSILLEPPKWATLIREVRLEPRPENLSGMTWELEVPAACGSLLVGTVEGSAVYLDYVSVGH